MHQNTAIQIGVAGTFTFFSFLSLYVTNVASVTLHFFIGYKCYTYLANWNF